MSLYKSKELTHGLDFRRSLFRIVSANFACTHILYIIDTIHLRGGGSKVTKNWEHDFKITGEPIGPPSGSTFWLGNEAPDLWGLALFWAQKIENGKLGIKPGFC